RTHAEIAEVVVLLDLAGREREVDGSGRGVHPARLRCSSLGHRVAAGQEPDERVVTGGVSGPVDRSDVSEQVGTREGDLPASDSLTVVVCSAGIGIVELLAVLLRGLKVAEVDGRLPAFGDRARLRG